MADQRYNQAEVGPITPEAGASFDLHGFWRILLRRRWLVIPFFFAALLVTVLFTVRQTRIYDAVCTIIIDLQAPRVLDKEQVQDVVESGTGGYWYTREYYETQYKVILSRAVAQRVVDRLNLQQNDKFLGIDDVSAGAEREQQRAAIDPTKVLLENLRIEPVRESRVVRLRYESPDPQFAALVANTVADSYITETLSVKTVTTASASDWLEQQLTDLERKLDESGRKLFDFKKSHDIVATSWEDRQSMVSQRLTQMNDALTRARVRKAELQARAEAVAALGAAVESGEGDVQALQPVATSRAIQELRLRYLETVSVCADLGVKYLEDHPKAESCRTRLAVARQALRDEVRLVLAAARNEFQETTKTEQNLRRLLEEAKSDAFGLNQYERDYLELKRTHDNNQRLYEMVLKRLKDTSVTGVLHVSNVRVLDRAIASTRPIKPNVTRNLAMALLFGLLGGVGLAFLAEYVDRTITSQQQVEERLGLTFLGVVPSIERGADGAPQDLFVHAQPKSAVAECLRAIRTNLLFMSPEKPLRTILVTSAGPQEGKTTTATSLAITMADSGSRVLLVDADMRRPRIHRIFGASGLQGLSSLILGQGTLEETVATTDVSNLWVLPCGPIPPNPAELLHTGAFAKLLEEMTKKFDRIIIDSPPIGVVADSVVMATLVDGTLVVLKAGKTDREMAAQSIRQLRDVKAPVFGAVLNDLDLSDQRYGQYSYYYQYGYYYGEGKGRRAASEPTKA